MINQKVKIKVGASDWMKKNGHWAEFMGENIDGKEGFIVGDYTDLTGNDKHYEVDIGLNYTVGVYPDFLVNLEKVEINNLLDEKK